MIFGPRKIPMVLRGPFAALDTVALEQKWQECMQRQEIDPVMRAALKRELVRRGVFASMSETNDEIKA